jgi:hypothetical protein
MVLGIVGKKFAGKDTLANIIKMKEPTNTVILHFADKLKEVCVDVFGIPMEYLQLPDKKETPLESPIAIDIYLEALSDTVKLTLQPKKLIARTPRELLQFVGTEYVRSVHPYYWVDALVDQIVEPAGKIYCVPDVRMLNEAEALKRFKETFVIKVNRILGTEAAQDLHQSEQEQETIVPDRTFNIKNGDFSHFGHIADFFIADFNLKLRA